MFLRTALAHKILGLAIVGQLLCTGCSDSDGGDDNQGGETLKELGIDDGASKGVSTSKLVKTTEETTLSLKTGAQVVIPEGALESDTKIGMTRPEDRTAANLVKTVEPSYKVASAPYVLTPHGTKFKRDVELTLPIAKSDGRRIAVAFLDDEKDTSWEVYEAEPVVSGKSATMKVAHFSVLVLLESTESTAMDAGLPDADVSEPDAEETPRDAGAPDASPEDAGLPDATLPDASLTLNQQLLARFAMCSLQSTQGTYTLIEEPDTARERCERSCLLSATCSDFATEYCPTGTPSTAFTNCMQACDGFTRISCLNDAGAPMQARRCDRIYECSGAEDEQDCGASNFFACDGNQSIPAAYVCDGDEDCYNNGDDEANCPNIAYFRCNNGERLSPDSRCNLVPECEDQSDETGCTYFNCASGEEQEPLKNVCNLRRDCADGSDEGTMCMHLTCIDQQQQL